MKICINLFAVLLCSCASMDPLEVTWQTINAVDVMQTSHFNDSPCHEEGNPLTQKLIGVNPSKDRVYQWGIGTAIGHYLLFNWVDDTFPKHSKLIRSIEIGYRANGVIRNELRGASFSGASTYCPQITNPTTETPTSVSATFKF